MHIAFEIVRAFVIISFAFYGVTCLVSAHMVAEFARYGLARFRPLVGWLEIVGALGMLAGYAYEPLLIAASAGLAVLMLLGVAARIRIRDSLLQTLPAAAYFGLNCLVIWVAVRGG